MLRVLALAAEVGLLTLVGYNLLIALAGWPNRLPAPPGAGRRRMRVVIPAHNEGHILGNLLDDLAVQDYPADLITVWVIADRCTDRTVDIAAVRAQVDVRTEGPEGKGEAIAWHLGRHPPEPEEALVVLDADNRVPDVLLTRFAAELEAGGRVLQAYLDVANPDGSMLATAGALSYWASNRMVQLARCNLGWTADLGGTGMCLTGAALQEAGGFQGSITEDQDLTARLLLAGIPVVWLHDVHIRDEKPDSLGVALHQRARWAGGKQRVGRRSAPALLRTALSTRSMAPADLALRLVQPSRSFVALLTAVLTVVAATYPSRYLLAWWVWAAAAAWQLLAPFPFLVRDRVPGRYLWRYPLMTVFGILWLPARILGRFSKRWYHTPHAGE